ncbi:MAG TPA: hypothetical protein VGO93_15290 [Candidatus Xenobia bacterium]|jgi:hypothetical protein
MKKKTVMGLALLGALSLAGSAHAVPTVVTVGTVHPFGNSFPFESLLSRHYQEVFSASDFPFVGPMDLTCIDFNSKGFGGPFSNSFTNVHICFSTTSKPVTTHACPGLCFTFANNIGADHATVVCGPLTLASAGGCFDINVPFTQPFLYDPCCGNLLMNIQIFCSGGCGISFEGQGTGGCGTCGFDGTLSRLFTNALHPGSSTVADSNSTNFGFNGALATRFTFTPTAAAPELDPSASTAAAGVVFGVFGVLADRRRNSDLPSRGQAAR